MNILVIGSKGFIGSNCVKTFSGKHEVWGCDIVPGEGENYIQLSEKNSFESILAQRQYDVCINASGSANVGSSYSNPVNDRQLNTDNVEIMLQALVKNNHECKFINFSSAAVYGNPVRLPITERAEVAPLSPYGKHKALSEEILKQYASDHKLRTCSLRVFSAYGPGLRKQLFWDIFLKTRQTQHIKLFGTGNESRDFIFIDDLMNAVESVIANASFDGTVVNIASGTETTIRDAATAFLGGLPGKYELEFSGEVKAGDPINWCGDISLLKSYGFTPRTALQEGLRKTAEGYLNDQLPGHV